MEPSQFNERLTKYQDEHPRASRSMIRLKELGCSVKLLDTLFIWYTAPDQGIEGLENRFGVSRRQLAAVQKRATDLAAEIRRLNETDLYPADPGWNLLQAIRDVGPGYLAAPSDGYEGLAESFRTLPDLLEHWAKCIDGWPHPLIRKELNDRQGGKETNLFWAATYVQKMTGSPHYRELADYAEAFYAAHGLAMEVDPENLRKAVDNYRIRNPEEAAILEAYTPEQFRAVADKAWAYARAQRKPETKPS